MAITLNEKHLSQFVIQQELDGIAPMVNTVSQMLEKESGLGSDFLGWLHLPTNYDKNEFARIKACATKIKKDSEVLLVIGIGGSYLGARSAIELLTSPFYNNMKKDTPDIIFVGCNISSNYLNEVLSMVDGRDFSVNIISKSGTTTEPALAFRVFRKLLIEK